VCGSERCQRQTHQAMMARPTTLLAWVLWRWHQSLSPAATGLRRPLAAVERAIWVGVGLLLPALAVVNAAIPRLEELGRRHDFGDFLLFVVEAGMGAAAATLIVLSALLRIRLRWAAGGRREGA
jgi:hypothetical protein